MWLGRKILVLTLISFMLLDTGIRRCQAAIIHESFIVKEAAFDRLCKTKSILTVNGQFPGPTIYANKGDTIIIDVSNQGNYNITIHCHGARLPRYPWSDGPAYVTQCPIKPGGKFTQKVILSTEEGTLFWHAHCEWLGATVYGAIVVYPQRGTHYPFPQPDAEFPIILGEWWQRDIMEVLEESRKTGADPQPSDALTINGQPGDLYPCSQNGTYSLKVEQGKTYLLRLINAALTETMFFAVAKHNLTVVAADASYTKPLTTEFVTVSPGQILDVLLHATEEPNQYYMAARAYSSIPKLAVDNTTTIAILLYAGNYKKSSPPPLPYLPNYNDSVAAFNLSSSLRSLCSEQYPVYVPSNVTTRLFTTLSMNAFPLQGGRISASMNNISFRDPSIDILQAYYNRINGVFGVDFPAVPPLIFNFTSEYQPVDLLTPEPGTKAIELDYGSIVELVLQGTSLLTGIYHPIHLHGQSFYVVGSGLGNFDENTDPLRYNLVDPPYRHTTLVPRNGWTAIRFTATNPGVWFMHCHLERHSKWGMDMVFIVKDGQGPDQTLLPPPPDMPPC